MRQAKPSRLGKCNAHEVLEKQLTITAWELIFLVIFVFLFFIFAFLVVPVTWGFF